MHFLKSGRATTVALLPLRSLHDGKRRLSEHLSPADRSALVRTLFERVWRALRDSAAIDRIAVVSPDSVLLHWASSFEVLPIVQHGQGLNAGLEQARDRLCVDQILLPDATLLVVLPDLPLLQPNDVRSIVALARDHPVVIAADRHEQGTNLLAQRPATAIPFRFGERSLDRHRAEATQRALDVAIYRSPGAALDLDTADDLQTLMALQHER